MIKERKEMIFDRADWVKAADKIGYVSSNHCTSNGRTVGYWNKNSGEGYILVQY